MRARRRVGRHASWLPRRPTGPLLRLLHFRRFRRRRFSRFLLAVVVTSTTTPRVVGDSLEAPLPDGAEADGRLAQPPGERNAFSLACTVGLCALPWPRPRDAACASRIISAAISPTLRRSDARIPLPRGLRRRGRVDLLPDVKLIA